MLIFLEGVDGSGKSSLAAEIARQIRARHTLDDVYERHSGPLKNDPFDEYVFSLDGYRPGSGEHIVADRWHLGEMVYGPIYRGGSALSDAQFRWVDAYLAGRGGVTFIVTNTLEEIERRLAERGEDFLQPEHVQQVIDGFNSVAAVCASYVETVVVGGDEPIEDIALRIIDRAEDFDDMARDLYFVSNSFVGSPINLDYLLVGEKRGGDAPYRTEGAFMPVAGNSAAYLWDALTDADACLSVGMINAKEESSISALVEVLNIGRDDDEKIKVVALGKEASKVLTQHGISHGSVPHPQFVRRFHNAKRAEYGSLIIQVAQSQEDRSKWPK